MHHNQPRFPFFFIYLYSGWILFLDLDLVSSGGWKKKKKRKGFSKVSIQYRETTKHFVIFLRLVFPRHNDFSRSNVFDRNTSRYPLFPSFDSPIPISRMNAFSVVQDNSPLYYIDQRNGFTLSRAHVSSPTDVLHVSLKFRANISSLIHKGER